jgi:ubiquinone/menaquinone biosynthesis C-methylase UbiE
MIALASHQASANASAARFAVSSVEALPGPDDHFDVVLASLMLHHLPPGIQRSGLAEVLRVLKPGGRFVVLDFSAMPGHGIGHLLTVLGLRRGTAHAEHLRSLMSTAGFDAVEVKSSQPHGFCILRARKPATAP